MLVTHSDFQLGRVNIYRIGLLLGGLDKVDAALENGATLRQAILSTYCDRALSACLKGVGQPDFTIEEKREADRASYAAFAAA